MDLRQMRYITEIANKGSISAAAANLFVTPQALSKAIKKIEEEFGALLFYNEKQGIYPTELGSYLIKESESILLRYREMEKQLFKIASVQKKHCKIVFSHGVPHALSSEFLNDFKNKYPMVELEMLELPDLIAEEYVQQEKYDIGFSIGIPNQQSEYVYTHIASYKVCAVMTREFPLAEKSTLSLEEVSKHPIITKNANYKIFHIVEEVAKNNNLKLNYILSSPNEVLWESMIKENKGVGIGISFLETHSQDKGFVAIPFSEPSMNWSIYLFHKKNHFMGEAAQNFYNHVKIWFEQINK